MVYIDFQGGAHGNYLEYVCNAIVANIPTGTQLPFNNTGASHSKEYLENKQFQAGHFFQNPGSIQHSKIISIKINDNDLLPLSLISLLRAGDYGFDNDCLEINTYNKLNNNSYRGLLDNIIRRYAQNQIADSYNAVRDPLWPEVSTLDEFKKLPDYIRKECLEYHNLYLLELSVDHPDCPRYILREFFKIGFKHPAQSGFLTEQQQNLYCLTNDLFIFPFDNFYNFNKFSEIVQWIASWANFEQPDLLKLEKLHDEFLARQPYRFAKTECDAIIQRIINTEKFTLPPLDLLKESYINAKLEQHYQIEMPFYQPVWFRDTEEIINYIKSQ
jgi:hypothetical protein